MYSKIMEYIILCINVNKFEDGHGDDIFNTQDPLINYLFNQQLDMSLSCYVGSQVEASRVLQARFWMVDFRVLTVDITILVGISIISQLFLNYFILFRLGHFPVRKL